MSKPLPFHNCVAKFRFRITAMGFAGKPHFVHHILYETHLYFSQEAVETYVY